METSPEILEFDLTVRGKTQYPLNVIPCSAFVTKGSSKKSKRLTPHKQSAYENEGKRLSGLIRGIFNLTLSIFINKMIMRSFYNQLIRKRYRKCAIT